VSLLHSKGLCIFGSVFVLAGAPLAYFGVQSMMRSQASEDWPITTGMVTSSSIDSWTSGGRVNYSAKVLYEFRVNHVGYVSGRVSFSDHSSDDPAHAQAIMLRYPMGQGVAVHYSPADAQHCVLEPGVQAWSWVPVGMGALFVAFGSTFVRFGLGMKRVEASLRGPRVLADVEVQ
jgi:hypothetical protein